MPLAPSPLPPGLRRILLSRQGWLVGFWLVCVTLIGLWFYQSSASDRRSALNAAENHLRSQVELVSLEINGKIESGDLALRTIIVLLGANPNWHMTPRDPLLWRILHDISDSLSARPRLALIDDKGLLRLHSHNTTDQGPTDLSERDYFRHHRDNPADEPFLGTPVMGKIAHSTVIPLTRRISRPDGSFSGVVLTSLDLAVSSALFSSLDHDRQIVFTLLRGDGTILVRHPAVASAVGNTLDIANLYPALSNGQASGFTISVSPIDGIERLSSFRRLDRFDLAIVAALPVETALKPWREQTQRMAVMIAACIFLITAAGLVLLRHIRAEAAAWTRIAASEEGLNRAQAIARVGSWQARLPDLALTCSNEARRLFALPEDGPIERMEVLERIHPEDRDRVLDAVRQIRQGQPIEIEHRLLIDGKVTWIKLRAELSAPPGDGEILGTVQDITERRQADESLRLQADELARSNTELEQFAYVASHDLREPLRMIASFVDLLGRRYGDRLDQDGLDFIAFAREGAARMDRLVLDLLDYSRIGRICKPMQTLDLGVLFDRVVLALALKVKENGADLILPDPPYPSVSGDPDELVRLLQNLINNAIKYREPSRPIVVRVATERHGGEVTVTVADNGIGIDPQYYDRIFGIFQRLHTRESFEGTGIGLAICKKIVERHGGRIWVHSVPGTGSTFRFTLPTADPA